MPKKVKEAFKWGTSSGQLVYECPAGAIARFNKNCNCWFVDPGTWPRGSFESHDATYRGCRVEESNLVDIN